jgi:phosphoribosylformimino-5-aminoimidazole carboxamide ribotide isomerase
MTRTESPGKLAKSAAIARRIAAPSAAQEGGKGAPANPPPLTHSWTRTVNAFPEAIVRMPYSVIPVLDLKDGKAVHAIGGRRTHYQPIRSILHASSEPIALARAIRDTLGLRTLYLADLDAIGGGPPNVRIYHQLIALNLNLWLDLGVRDVSSVAPLLELGSTGCTIVVGLETVRGPSELAGVLDLAGAERVIFSLDLFDGRPLTAAPRAWATEDPWELVQIVIERGVRHVLVLDLSRVGTGRGLGNEGLLVRVREAHPGISLSVGGGISTIEEVIDLKTAGADGVLVGSALHDGRIGHRQLARLTARELGDSTRLDAGVPTPLDLG